MKYCIRWEHHQKYLKMFFHQDYSRSSDVDLPNKILEAVIEFSKSSSE